MIVIGWRHRQIRFIQEVPVNKYLSIQNLQPITRQADDTFDEATGRIQRKIENNNVSSPRISQGILQFIHDHELAVNQTGLHAVPFHSNPCGNHINYEK